MYFLSRSKMVYKSRIYVVTYFFIVVIFCLVFAYTFFGNGGKKEMNHLEDDKITTPSFVDYLSDLRTSFRDQISPQKEEIVDKTSAFVKELPTDEDTTNEHCPRSSRLLKRLRALMNDPTHVPVALDAYLILGQDAHQNIEFISDRDRRVQYLSGYTGDSGKIVVTKNKSYLLVSYPEEEEISGVDENWILTEGKEDASAFGEWFDVTLTEGAKIGFDPFKLQYRVWEELQETLKLQKQTLVPVSENLVDLIWTNQTSLSNIPVFPLELHYSGETSQSKIERVRLKMTSSGATVYLIHALDEIAWLLNLRGLDIPYVPVFFAYVIITPTEVCLFVDESKITPEVRQHLLDEKSNVVMHPYSSTLQHFIEILEKDTTPENKVWLTKDISYAFANVVPEHKLQFIDSPVAYMKAIKNEVEIEGFKNAHIKDAAAFCRFFAWLENEITQGHSNVTELTAEQKLEEYRKLHRYYIGPSFPTVSASGPNGAHIHYKATLETNRRINASEIYLCDAGAHYKDGTTDFTRTVHFGTPSEYEKECYTRVLKGFIQLRTMKFPESTKGTILDAFARKSLWDAGLEYFHGTGHGIGNVLNVHELPMDVSRSGDPNDPGFHENMLISNEPGYYEEGRFGIRIENIVRTVPARTKYGRVYRRFLTFEDLTFVPLIRANKLLDFKMLTEDEVQYINDYHAKCRENIAPFLRAENADEALAWLMKETEPI